MNRAESVDAYIAAHDQWADALTKLREVLTSTELEETIKWGAPCYTLDGKNVIGLTAFKNHAALWFHQGALLSDPDAVLLNAQEGKTKAQRQWRFTSAKDIKKTRVKAYVKEAIELQRAGAEIKPDRDKPILIPAELKAAFKEHPAARKAFDAMSKSCRREYADHVAEAKREDTRLRRAAKIIPMIESGAGLNDKYR
ncbi:MAG: hypothetical protein CMJ31_11140 [Phycisphaerae bacterium]|nr:hypothetical protein [Phycisphaerae bacterium]